MKKFLILISFVAALNAGVYKDYKNCEGAKTSMVCYAKIETARLTIKRCNKLAASANAAMGDFTKDKSAIDNYTASIQIKVRLEDELMMCTDLYKDMSKEAYIQERLNLIKMLKNIGVKIYDNINN